MSSAPQPPAAVTSTGLDLRQRRRVRTKLGVQSEALDLFREKGYGRTSVEDIAHAAAISPRTFYRYFACKEDVVLWDQYDDVPPAQVWAIQPGDDVFTVMTRRLREVTAQLYTEDPGRFLFRTALMFRVPEVRARFVARAFELVEAYYVQLVDELGVPGDDVRVSVPAVAATAALLVAMESWQRHDGSEDLLALIDDAFAALPGPPPAPGRHPAQITG